MSARHPFILCIHQGAELYGSDRSFLQAVGAFRAGWPEASIKVVLAADGPLRERLEEIADEVVVRDLFVLRMATPIKTAFQATLGLPWYFAAALRDIARAELAYINTVVIVDYMLVARIARAKTIIHAREIPRSLALPVVRGLIRAAGARMIYNSRATRQALATGAGTGAVIYNGFDPVLGARAPRPPADGYTPDRPLRIAMLGRINNWKGQDVLVAAAALLCAADRKCVQIRIVGGTYGETTVPLDAIINQIAKAGVGGSVSVEPFNENPGDVYRWADLCAVPSRLPEPFGRVAIEAMAYGRAVLASAHGGLVEIVEHGRSGWLLPPGDAAALATAIREILAEPDLVARRGAEALARFNTCFTSATMTRRLQEAVRVVLQPAAAGIAL